MASWDESEYRLQQKENARRLSREHGRPIENQTTPRRANDDQVRFRENPFFETIEDVAMWGFTGWRGGIWGRQE